MNFCRECGLVKDCPHQPVPYKTIAFNINESLNHILKRLDTNIFPDLIKGVKGTSNKEHIPEHLMKGILRAKHRLYVNKDGTIRYDCSEIPLTHFKPKEIGVGVERLRELGYDYDIKRIELKSDEQVLELKPQDILLPCSPGAPEEPADEILFRTTCFVDELLVKLYGLKPYYNLKSKQDLIGHMVIHIFTQP
jgi:DNA polymerase II large subunit